MHSKFIVNRWSIINHSFVVFGAPKNYYIATHKVFEDDIKWRIIIVNVTNQNWLLYWYICIDTFFYIFYVYLVKMTYYNVFRLYVLLPSLNILIVNRVLTSVLFSPLSVSAFSITLCLSLLSHSSSFYNYYYYY